jgi:hypothetical protein
VAPLPAPELTLRELCVFGWLEFHAYVGWVMERLRLRPGPIEQPLRVAA